MSEASLKNFRIGVSAVIFQDGKVLLALRRDIGWWNLPGGGMEIGETVEEAVVREVLEETGLVVVVERLLGVYSKPQKQEVLLGFICRRIGGELKATEESSACQFFPPNQLPAKLLPKHRQRVEDALLNQPQALLRNQLTTTEEDQLLAKE
jgi:ADP-ribose pyrophosphatase